MSAVVTFSGAVLSSMLYDNLKSDHVKEGFLFGEITKVTRQRITDSDTPAENTVSTINVTSFLSCPTVGNFYDGFGNIKESYLKTYLGKSQQKLVGWYKCRGSWDDIYLKERIIHEGLQKMVPTDQHFIFGVFSSPSKGTSGLMYALYMFYEAKENGLESVSHSIINMSDTNGSTYKRDAPTAPLYESQTFTNSLKCISNFEPGVKETESFYGEMLKNLKLLLPQCADTSERYSKYTDEVIRLRALCHESNLVPDFEPCDEIEKPVAATKNVKLLKKKKPVTKSTSANHNLKSENTRLAGVNGESEESSKCHSSPEKSSPTRRSASKAKLRMSSASPSSRPLRKLTPKKL